MGSTVSDMRGTSRATPVVAPAAAKGQALLQSARAQGGNQGPARQGPSSVVAAVQRSGVTGTAETPRETAQPRRTAAQAAAPVPPTSSPAQPPAAPAATVAQGGPPAQTSAAVTRLPAKAQSGAGTRLDLVA